MVGLGHVVAAGTEPLKQEDGASCGLDSHHHHQHPWGEVEWLEEGGGGDYPRSLGHEDGDSGLQERNGEINYRFPEQGKLEMIYYGYLFVKRSRKFFKEMNME